MLHELNLSNNNFGSLSSNQMKELGQGIRDNLNLIRLDISKNKLSRKAKFLIEKLSSSGSLQELNLRDNVIDEENAKAIYEMIKNSRLCALNLEGNLIGNQTIEAISSALRYNKSFYYLNIAK